MHRLVRGAARRVLAVGAPDADATLALEEALASDGMLILMERDRDRAEDARRRFGSTGLGTRATIIAGDPRRMLHKLAGPFDVIVCTNADPSIREKLSALLARDGVFITNGKTRGV